MLLTIFYYYLKYRIPVSIRSDPADDWYGGLGHTKMKNVDAKRSEIKFLFYSAQYAIAGS